MGNLVGTDASGLAALGNAGDGLNPVLHNASVEVGCDPSGSGEGEQFLGTGRGGPFRGDIEVDPAKGPWVTMTATSTSPVSATSEFSRCFRMGLAIDDAASTAEGSEDYLATSGTLAFAAGETVKTITVDVVGDTIGSY